VNLFRLVRGGRTAVRVPVQLGRASYQAVEVLGGLNVGDEVILSDMSRWQKADRVELR
jgi:multidrug efflux pump subunit AcrA (membrane-fusion protein)